MSDKVPTAALGRGAVTQDQPMGLLDEAGRLAVAGLAISRPNWDGVIVLPGDPGHWVHLSAGEIVSFQSFLTLRLARALGAADQPDMAALHDTMSRPERLATQLRSAELGGNRDAILGHLLGAELAAAKPYWLGQEVIILQGEASGAPYRDALAQMAVPVTLQAQTPCRDAAIEALGAS